MLLLRKAKSFKILYSCRKKESYKFEYEVVTVRMRNQTDTPGIYGETKGKPIDIVCATDMELRAER